MRSTPSLLLGSLATLIPVSVVAAPTHTLGFGDIKDAPPAVLDTVEATLLDMAAELGLTDEVDDIVVVGSMAYGIGRVHDPVRPSDLDVVLYMRAVSKDPAGTLAGFEAFREASLRYRKLLQARLHTNMDFDIKVNTRPLAELVADPDWVGFSLLSRRFYNREGGAPRAVKGHFHDDTYYVFDRNEYQRVVAELKASPRPLLERVDGDQLVLHDRQAWEQGEPSELLRSLHKRPGRRSVER